MATITCTVQNRSFNVKKICKVSEMPKNATAYFTCFTPHGIVEIYATPSFIYYATPAKQPK